MLAIAQVHNITRGGIQLLGLVAVGMQLARIAGICCHVNPTFG
jgi:hypothetical protein